MKVIKRILLSSLMSLTLTTNVIAYEAALKKTASVMGKQLEAKVIEEGKKAKASQAPRNSLEEVKELGSLVKSVFGKDGSFSEEKYTELNKKVSSLATRGLLGLLEFIPTIGPVAGAVGSIVTPFVDSFYNSALWAPIYGMQAGVARFGTKPVRVIYNGLMGKKEKAAQGQRVRTLPSATAAGS